MVFFRNFVAFKGSPQRSPPPDIHFLVQFPPPESWMDTLASKEQNMAKVMGVTFKLRLQKTNVYLDCTLSLALLNYTF